MMINMPKIVFEVVLCMLFTVKKKVRSAIARQFVFCTRACPERAICKLAFIFPFSILRLCLEPAERII